jgi:hypothetical protein
VSIGLCVVGSQPRDLITKVIGQLLSKFGTTGLGTKTAIPSHEFSIGSWHFAWLAVDVPPHIFKASTSAKHVGRMPMFIHVPELFLVSSYYLTLSCKFRPTFHPFFLIPSLSFTRANDDAYSQWR